jgi:hypothetical protein
VNVKTRSPAQAPPESLPDAHCAAHGTEETLRESEAANDRATFPIRNFLNQNVPRSQILARNEMSLEPLSPAHNAEHDRF